jgi:hypothetical protein
MRSHSLRFAGLSFTAPVAARPGLVVSRQQRHTEERGDQFPRPRWLGDPATMGSIVPTLTSAREDDQGDA